MERAAIQRPGGLFKLLAGVMGSSVAASQVFVGDTVERAAEVTVGMREEIAVGPNLRGGQ